MRTPCTLPLDPPLLRPRLYVSGCFFGRFITFCPRVKGVFKPQKRRFPKMPPRGWSFFFKTSASRQRLVWMDEKEGSRIRRHRYNTIEYNVLYFERVDT